MCIEINPMLTWRGRQADFVACVLSLRRGVIITGNKTPLFHDIDENLEQGLTTFVNDTGDNFLAVTKYRSNLSPVTTTPANSLSPISPWVFEKIRNNPNMYVSQGPCRWNVICEKKNQVDILVSDSL